MRHQRFRVSPDSLDLADRVLLIAMAQRTELTDPQLSVVLKIHAFGVRLPATARAAGKRLASAHDRTDGQ